MVRELTKIGMKQQCKKLQCMQMLTAT